VTKATPNQDLTSVEAANVAWTRRACVSGLARQIRLDAHLSSVEASRVVGVSHSAVLAWEAASRLPRGHRAVRYGEFLRMLERTATP
jgi:DNA-binding transcriptional regulator YiaG